MYEPSELLWNRNAMGLGFYGDGIEMNSLPATCRSITVLGTEEAWRSLRFLAVVSRKSDTGSKGYPFLGSAQGAKEAVDLFTRRRIVGGERDEHEGKRQTRTRRSTQVQAARRLTALLLHVWIDVIIVASYKWCSDQGTRQGGG